MKMFVTGLVRVSSPFKYSFHLKVPLVSLGSPKQMDKCLWRKAEPSDSPLADWVNKIMERPQFWFDGAHSSPSFLKIGS